MMGSGKSITGKSLATLMRYPFVDLDAEIEKNQKRSISEIFAKEGEKFFREEERKTLQFFSEKPSSVVATGGGIILLERNVIRMRETGTVVYLKASVQALWQRVRYSTDRPLLNKPDPLGTLRQILEDREPLYQSSCHFSVLTDEKTPEEVARDIFEVLLTRS